jgi:hypothetical protein
VLAINPSFCIQAPLPLRLRHPSRQRARRMKVPDDSRAESGAMGTLTMRAEITPPRRIPAPLDLRTLRLYHMGRRRSSPAVSNSWLYSPSTIVGIARKTRLTWYQRPPIMASRSKDVPHTAAFDEYETIARMEGASDGAHGSVCIAWSPGGAAGHFLHFLFCGRIRK